MQLIVINYKYCILVYIIYYSSIVSYIFNTKKARMKSGLSYINVLIFLTKVKDNAATPHHTTPRRAE